MSREYGCNDYAVGDIAPTLRHLSFTDRCNLQDDDRSNRFAPFHELEAFADSL
jgi:hypothetical protein